MSRPVKILLGASAAALVLVAAFAALSNDPTGASLRSLRGGGDVKTGMFEGKAVNGYLIYCDLCKGGQLDVTFDTELPTYPNYVNVAMFTTLPDMPQWKLKSRRKEIIQGSYKSRPNLALGGWKTFLRRARRDGGYVTLLPASKSMVKIALLEGGLDENWTKLGQTLADSKVKIAKIGEKFDIQKLLAAAAEDVNGKAYVDGSTQKLEKFIIAVTDSSLVFTKAGVKLESLPIEEQMEVAEDLADEANEEALDFEESVYIKAAEKIFQPADRSIARNVMLIGDTLKGELKNDEGEWIEAEIHVHIGMKYGASDGEFIIM